ncbi:Bgt-20980 [Blumeria graminis f. sp. tritici]|uniref:Bgt-20980 n=2 Tax=Blumeria graminis f. sp. tritici TaxID=62690 RepID=A0A9X9MLC3_BLUGR|nr:Bgt-20980 [Blumeria graminis f. sp. tritici]
MSPRLTHELFSSLEALSSRLPWYHSFYCLFSVSTILCPFPLAAAKLTLQDECASKIYRLTHRCFGFCRMHWLVFQRDECSCMKSAKKINGEWYHLSSYE